MPRTPATTQRSPEPEPLRAFIYDRNSRDPRGLGTSVRDQGTENRRLCDMYGWVIAGQFQDPGRSASRYATRRRDDYEAMVERMREGGCDVLVMWEASRGYRNSRAYLDLRDLLESRGILLCYNGRLYNMERSDDRYITGMDALNAEREADAIRDRNRRTHRLILERGDPPGRLPYGFAREYDPRTGALVRQVVDPAQGEVVREIARRVREGQSCNSIARDLNRRGVAPPWTSAAWTLESVKRVVVRPSSAGKRDHRGRVVGGAAWPAILEESDWQACVRILTDPARLNHHGAQVRHLLSGLVFCGPCGGSARLRPKTVKGGLSYVCQGCYRVSMRAAMLEAYAVELVLGYVEREDFASSLMAADADCGDAAARAVAEAKAYEAQLAEATELAGQLAPGRGGVLVPALSAARLAAMEADLLPKIDAARARARDASVPAVLHDVAGPAARSVWDEQLDIERRRTVIREVVRLQLNGGGMGARRIVPGRITHEWLR